jgi:8-oxo-dGTP pyrophosphatase MutT (NUDIX family)
MGTADVDRNRPAAEPRDAATLVVARDARGGGVEVFFVERQKVGFLGGAVVFPGGKLEASDMDPAWIDRSTPPQATHTPIAADEATSRGLVIAACREALEEAAILPVDGPPIPHADLVAWRALLAKKEGTLLELLCARGARLDLGSLWPLARWITPASEPRRFDTRFFLVVADGTLTGRHDDHETTASFWATPSDVLRRFESRQLQLAPPTHRTLEVLATAGDAGEAVAIARRACLDPVCPRMFTLHDAAGDVFAIALPGDPEHDIRERRSPGKSRYVLRGDRFLPEDPPA